MKKIAAALIFILLSLTALPTQAADPIAKRPEVSVPSPTPEEKTEAKVLISRLNEINSMDKSKLNSSEKKNLRKEVKSIKSRLKDISGGIYISGAALVVIIILLLVLL